MLIYRWAVQSTDKHTKTQNSIEIIVDFWNLPFFFFNFIRFSVRVNEMFCLRTSSSVWIFLYLVLFLWKKKIVVFDPMNKYFNADQYLKKFDTCIWTILHVYLCSIMIMKKESFFIYTIIQSIQVLVTQYLNYADDPFNWAEDIL